jgi:hypothetical protein
MDAVSPRLEQIQGEFFKALRGESSILPDLVDPIGLLSREDCIEVYRRGYMARLTEALGETFEACWWVLGDDDFLSLAQAFISQNISQTYDLSDYGFEFPEFLDRSGACDDIPFVAHLARFEWAFKTIFHKKNLPSETVDWQTASFGQGEARFHLAPSALLFHAPFSVYEIWRRREQKIDELNSVDWSSEENLILFKRDSQVYVKRLDSTTFALMESLASGMNLENSIEKRFAEIGSGLTPETVQSSFTLIAQLGVFSL